MSSCHIFSLLFLSGISLVALGVTFSSFIVWLFTLGDLFLLDCDLDSYFVCISFKLSLLTTFFVEFYYFNLLLLSIFIDCEDWNLLVFSWIMSDRRADEWRSPGFFAFTYEFIFGTFLPIITFDLDYFKLELIFALYITLTSGRTSLTFWGMIIDFSTDSWDDCEYDFL